jgi:2'-5' RNA ligase
VAAMVRSFIAIPLPGSMARRVEELVRKLGEVVTGVRWVAPGHAHLTIAFLGDIAIERVAELGRSLGEQLVGIGPFELELAGLGAFPTRERPRVLWVGLRSSDELIQLRKVHDAVHKALVACGLTAADGRFSPHVTLGRVKPRSRLQVGEGWDRLGEQSLGSFRAAEVVLFSSQLTRGGSVYDRLASLRLSERGA